MSYSRTSNYPVHAVREFHLRVHTCVYLDKMALFLYIATGYDKQLVRLEFSHRRFEGVCFVGMT